MLIGINQAPPVIGVTDSGVNRPYRQGAGAAVNRAVQNTGTLDYNGLLAKFQRRFSHNRS